MFAAAHYTGAAANISDYRLPKFGIKDREYSCAYFKNIALLIYVT